MILTSKNKLENGNWVHSSHVIFILLHYTLTQPTGYDNSLMCLAGGDEFSLVVQGWYFAAFEKRLTHILKNSPYFS